MSKACDAAAKLIEELGITSPDEIIIEDIAFARGVLVMEKPIYAAEGRLVCDENRGIISINSSIVENGKKRFAASHELGHFELHRALEKNAIYACDEDDFVDLHRCRPEETEANEFAAELLMPSKIFKSEMNHQMSHIEKIKFLAKRFQTSITATAIRYIDFAQIPMVLISSTAGKVCWYKKHPNFSYYIQINVPVLKGSAAYDCFKKKKSIENAKVVLANTWFSEDFKVKKDTYFNEVCIFSVTYDTALSLVWEYDLPH